MCVANQSLSGNTFGIILNGSKKPPSSIKSNKDRNNKEDEDDDRRRRGEGGRKRRNNNKTRTGFPRGSLLAEVLVTSLFLVPLW